MPNGFGVNPADLTSASTRIVDCLSGVEGMDLEGVSGDGSAYGHGGVYESLATFCSTWQVATVLLAQRAGSLSQALTGAAGLYSDQDQGSAQALAQQGP